MHEAMLLIDAFKTPSQSTTAMESKLSLKYDATVSINIP